MELHNRGYVINHKTVQRLMKELGIKCMVRIQKYRSYKGEVMDMLNKAFAKIPDNTNLIFHSDQDWQYQHKHYQKRLIDKGIQQSMSRKGNCIDNSVMENFFGLLKSELLYLREFESIDEFVMELEKYIDYYNNKRIKSKLKGLSPVQYRIQSSLVA